jgi:hypothetical protein
MENGAIKSPCRRKSVRQGADFVAYEQSYLPNEDNVHFDELISRFPRINQPNHLLGNRLRWAVSCNAWKFA